MVSGKIDDWCPVPQDPRTTDLSLSRYHLEKALEHMENAAAPPEVLDLFRYQSDWLEEQLRLRFAQKGKSQL